MMKKSFKLFFALILGIAINTGIMNAQSYTVNAESSGLEWTGKKVTGQHNGTVSIKEGTVSLKEGALSGEFVIDMTSITCTDIENPEYNQNLVGHLKSDDFFSVSDHATAHFVITASEAYSNPNERANTLVTGNLTIKGITNEISFPAHIMQDEGFTAIANFKIDRTKWNIRYGSGSFFENLGDKTIYDDIEFGLVLRAK